MAGNENIPTYFKIYQNLKHKIIDGEFEKGSKIDAIGEMAKEFGVAPETIRRAIHLLETEGLLARRQGFGTIIPESANLHPFELGKLITENKLTPTFLDSKVYVYSAEWVAPSYRIVQLYNLGQESSEYRVFKIFFRIDMSDKYSPGLRALITHFFSEATLRTFKIDKGMQPYDMLVSTARWLDSMPHKTTERLHPRLCVDEQARLLDLPDGTPVFYQEFIEHGEICPTHFWDFTSNATTLSNETEFNQDKLYGFQSDNNQIKKLSVG